MASGWLQVSGLNELLNHFAGSSLVCRGRSISLAHKFNLADRSLPANDSPLAMGIGQILNYEGNAFKVAPFGGCKMMLFALMPRK